MRRNVRLWNWKLGLLIEIKGEAKWDGGGKKKWFNDGL